MMSSGRRRRSKRLKRQDKKRKVKRQKGRGDENNTGWAEEGGGQGVPWIGGEGWKGGRKEERGDQPHERLCGKTPVLSSNRTIGKIEMSLPHNDGMAASSLLFVFAGPCSIPPLALRTTRCKHWLHGRPEDANIGQHTTLLSAFLQLRGTYADETIFSQLAKKKSYFFRSGARGLFFLPTPARLTSSAWASEHSICRDLVSYAVCGESMPYPRILFADSFGRGEHVGRPLPFGVDGQMPDTSANPARKGKTNMG